MNLNDIVTAINPKCSFIPSLVRQTPDPPRFYTFLHIPKCAGIDFELPYKTALTYHCNKNKKPAFTARADDEAAFENTLTSIQAILSKGFDFNQCHGIIASHLGIKRLSRENIVPKDHIITILRHPVDRLISLFNYNCMRANKPPLLDDFNDFITREDSINQISFLLDAEEATPVDALENKIRSSFFACIDVTRSRFFLGELLSRSLLPNVIKENSNQTLPEFKLTKSDIPGGVLEKLIRLNARDIDLYQRFKAVPLEPDILDRGTINLETLLLSDEQTQEKSKSKMFFVKTDPFLGFLQKNKANLPNRLGTIIQGLVEKNKPA